MFKTPEWGDDVPNLHKSFMKKNEKKANKTPAAKVTLNVNKIRSKKASSINQNSIQNSSKFSPKKERKTSEQRKPFNNQLRDKTTNNAKKKISHNNNVKQKILELKITPKVNSVTNKQTVSIQNGVNKTSKKHKLDVKPVQNKKKKKIQPEDLQNLDKIQDTQNFDEILLNAKKRKFYEVFENEDKEDLLFSETKLKKDEEISENKKVKPVINVQNISKTTKTKDRIRAMLAQSNRTSINVGNKSNQLRQRMLERLKAAQFRYLNEKLYTSSGSDAQQLFKADPAAFETYHQGYQLQVKKWPVNPLDVIVKKIIKMPNSHLIADMGCGEAALSRRIPHKVRSFDLVATAPGVEACDMARTPLLSASMDVAVYCLALMGTDLTQYLVEANRVLKTGGQLLIAEVESRFDNVDNFTKEVQRLGFKLKQLDKSNNVFFFIEFTKVNDPPVKKGKLPALTLKPCIYKRR